MLPHRVQRLAKTGIPAAVATLFAVILSMAAGGERAERLDLTAQQWRQDLQFLERELPKRHASAFHFITRERFEQEIAQLDARLGRLNGDEVYVGMSRIASLVGDAHTYVQFPRDDAHLPIALGRFGDGLRVTAVAAGMEKGLGARVVKVQDTPIEQARELLRTITPQDENAPLGEALIPQYLTLGIVLHGFGITPDRSVARYTFAGDNGDEFTLEVQALSPGAPAIWISACPKPPLSRQNPEKKFWTTYLPEARTVYCNVRSLRDLRGPGRELVKLLEEKKADKLVIDLRQNGGGDYLEGQHHLIEPIRDIPGINKKGHLFVLVGALTFSAAMSNAAQFRSMTAAILVGGTLGEKPDSYQEPREMTLPNSGLTIRYSTRLYEFMKGGENIIRPDQEIHPTWEDFKAGRDPVLDWVLQYGG